MAKTKYNNEKETPAETKTATEKETTSVLTATQNTFLPDGTFVEAGEQVTVSAEYAEKVLAELNSPFKK